MCVPNEDYVCFGGWTGFAAPLYWVEELAATQDEGPRGTGALIVEVLRAALRERAAGVHPEDKGVGRQLLLGRIKRTCGEDLS